MSDVHNHIEVPGRNHEDESVRAFDQLPETPMTETADKADNTTGFAG